MQNSMVLHSIKFDDKLRLRVYACSSLRYKDSAAEFRSKLRRHSRGRGLSRGSHNVQKGICHSAQEYSPEDWKDDTISEVLCDSGAP